MTDYDKVKNLLDDLDIEYEEDECLCPRKDYDPYKILHLVTGTRNVRGYDGFQCNFEFDMDGSFLNIRLGE